MNIRTVNLTLSAPVSIVYGFLSRVENLPLWATEFCERAWPDGSVWKIATSQGEMTVTFRLDATTGVIDQLIGPTVEQQGLFPIRVFALGPMTLVQFTFVQPPGLPDAVYERQFSSLLTEMRALAVRFGGGTLYAPGFPGEIIVGQQ